jgi:signal transduction histidine kinase
MSDVLRAPRILRRAAHAAPQDARGHAAPDVAADVAPGTSPGGPAPRRGFHGLAPVVLALGLLALVEAVLLDPSGAGPTPLAQAAPGVMAYSAVLLSGVLVAHRHTVSRHEGDAWLVLALMFLGAQGLSLSVLAAAAPAETVARAGLLSGLDVAVTGTALVVAAVAARTRRFTGSPLAIGAVVVVGVVGVRVLATYAGPAIPAGSGTVAALAGLGVQLHLVLAAVVLDADGPPAWLRVRIAAAVGLHGVLTASTYLVPGTLRQQVAFLTAIGVAALVVTTALRLVRVTMTDQRATHDELEDQLLRANAAVRDDREKMHEIGATLAGIASASDLLRSGAPAVQERKAALEQMMHAEVARLQRLMHGPEPVGAVDLDDAVRHVVVSHRARGTVVAWRPTGAVVSGRSDAIAEIVNILLDNAAHHGTPDVAVEVEVHALDATEHDDWVEVRVTDRGPGIPGELRERIFEHGVSRAGSPGQGLGLAIAHGLADELGGSLRLHQTSPRGTTFAVRLLRHRVAAPVRSAS